MEIFGKVVVFITSHHFHLNLPLYSTFTLLDLYKQTSYRFTSFIYCINKPTYIISVCLVLGWQQTESLLQGNSLSGVLVIWRESSRVSRLGDLTVSSDLVQGVDSLAIWAQSVHQMHAE